MHETTDFDGCAEFDDRLMEAAMLGRGNPGLDAHLEECAPCTVALAGYQLATRAIRGANKNAPSAPVAERHPALRLVAPRTLIAAASVAAALMALVHFMGVAPQPADSGELPPALVVSNSGASDDGDASATSAAFIDLAVPMADDGPLLPADIAEAPREKIECIEIASGCLCCVGCDIQMLVGGDQLEHRIPAALQGLELGIRVGVGDQVTSSTFPHGGFILSHRSALL